MSKHKKEPDVSGTFAGITTPMDQQDMASTDKISGYVETLMDRMAGNEDKLPHEDRPSYRAEGTASDKPRQNR
ncbi:hypothetical protein SAMN02799630_04333 [Paenibacillus sp. UNCCL117]|uniref:hypothetical protein n=1 Tax=unclassified Paenibacillus TaxID=185978 RepID=UPI00087EBF7D|nr:MULTISPECIES: hypothetical protein [unclassified Paenibacillus]SDD97148.1 hypothetical protein SAMN04488602_11660 [Paenibacillus sp. cl123]SFW56248.1 hypothetical protein SAMN02799630_04333 [Paenibacillus sp. UNCCL117]